MGFVGAGSTITPLVSVIIPLHRDGSVFRKCLRRLLEIESDAPFEVVVVSDRDVADLPSGVVFAPTGSPTDTSPAAKRDSAASVARGEYLAFIDDDAYPKSDWLDRAMEALEQSSAVAVGGPGVTPPESSGRERVGGAIYESRLGSGPLRYRFVPLGSPRGADDLPAYNLVIERVALEAVGGWSSDFYGGEDTKLCLALVRAGFHLQYDPRVVVFHHRRPILMPHIRQIANVGRHRGFFVRRYPETSRRGVYFLPATLVIAMVSATPLLIALGKRWPRRTAATLVVGWLSMAAPSIRSARRMGLLFPGVLLAHHAAYGWSFIRGLLGAEIER